MVANKCPNCGAKVKLNPDTDLMYCEHCGYKQTEHTSEDPKQNPAPAQETVALSQSQANKATVLYDKNGNPVFVQSIQNAAPTPEQQKENEQKKRKVGPFVASLVTLVLSFVFMALSVVFFYQFVKGADSSAGSVVLFLVYMFTGLGLATFLPGLGLSIASLVCSCLALKSSIKALRIISIFVVIFATLAVIVSVAIPFFIPYTFEASTSSSSTTTSILL